MRVAFYEQGMTTLTFRVYDKALLDTPLEKGHFDGKPGKHPRAASDARISNTFRDNATLTFGSISHSSETIGGLKVLPIYQTMTGFRVYYVIDSYHETGSDARRFKFFVQKPVGM